MSTGFAMEGTKLLATSMYFDEHFSAINDQADLP